MLRVETLFLAATVVAWTSSLASSQCTGFTVIEEPKRSTQYIYRPGNGDPLCDTWLNPNTWYTFRSHSRAVMMPETCVQPNRCNTQGAIYLNGVHPPAGSTTSVNIQAATNLAVSCTDWTTTVSVQWCAGTPPFYVYRLQPVPGCNMAYCAGNGTVCDPGQSWNSVQEQCMTIPTMSTVPLLEEPRIVERRTVNVSSGGGTVPMVVERFAFHCNLRHTPPPTDDGLRFRVTFLFDDTIMDTVSNGDRLEPVHVNSSFPIAELSEQFLRGRLNREVSCSVRPYWEGSSDQMGTAVTSNKYWAGIRALLSPVEVRVGVNATTIVVNSTIPITCWYCAMNPQQAAFFCYQPCHYLFSVSKNTSSDTTFTCTLNMTQSSRRGEIQTIFNPPVEGVDSDKYEAVIRFDPYVATNMFFNGTYRCLYREYIVRPIQLRINDNGQRRHCYSYGDPNYQTFDGRRFGISAEGDHVLVKSTTSLKYLEIQVRFDSYNSAFENCAIIVREGNSVLKLDNCQRNQPVQLIRLLATDPPDGSSISKNPSTNEYNINMPSGLRVKMWNQPYWRFEVFLPHEFVGLTGICGNANGNQNDDVTTGSTFRVPSSDNMFYNTLTCKNYTRDISACTCQELEDGTRVVDCSNSPIEKGSEIQPEWKTIHEPCIENINRLSLAKLCKSSRTVYDIMDDNILDNADVYYNFTYDPTDRDDFTVTWPTPTGKTEAQVRQFCDNAIRNSAVYDSCKDTVDVEGITNSCIADVGLSDNYDAATPYFSTLEDECIYAKRRESTVGSPEEIGESPAVKEITDHVCPNQCNGHGLCVNGTCICNAGFMGFDCSLVEGTPPVITGIYRGGLCDYRQRHCAQINVYATNLVESQSLVCRFKHLETGEYSVTNATMKSIGEVVCPLPDPDYEFSKYELELTLTNDGEKFSNEHSVVVYDSVCMSCTTGAICSQKADTCLIDNICYANGDKMPSAECTYCVPGQSTIAGTDLAVWTDWSACSVSCEVGIQSRDLICMGEEPPIILRTEVQECNAGECVVSTETTTTTTTTTTPEPTTITTTITSTTTTTPPSTLPPLIPDCGDVLHNAPDHIDVPPGWSILCQINKYDDVDAWNTQCRDTLVGLPRYENADGLLGNGGNFGCWTTSDFPSEELAEACVDNYQHDLVPGYCFSCQTLAVCIRFPA